MPALKLARNLNFARNIRARQILARIAITMKRRWLAYSNAYWPVKLKSSPPPVTGGNALPLFPPLGGCRPAGAGVYEFHFLNDMRRLTLPLDWQRREYHGSSQLWSFNLHYMEYLESVDDADFEALVLDWIRGNPPYRPRYWTNAWNSYTLSIRALVWMQQLSARQSRLRAETVERILSSLWAQLDFLTHNIERDIGGNHILKNIKSMLWAGRFFSGPEAAKLRNTGTRLLESELREQILTDGFHFERSPSYHCQVFCDLLECWLVLNDPVLRDHLGKLLRRMAQVIADTTHDDGFASLFNDGGLHYARAPRVCLAAYCAATAEQAPVPRRHFAFPDAGYFGARMPGYYCLADAGAVAPDWLVAHGHADTLAFELSTSGGRMIVDAGVFEYNAGAMRDYCRGTAAHNTVTVDGISSSDCFGSFRMGRRARILEADWRTDETGASLRASHSGFTHLAGRPIHERSFTWSVSKIAIRDRIRGGAGQPCEARLLFHPDCAVRLSENVLELQSGSKYIVIRSERPMRLQKAWYCPDFGVKRDTEQLILDLGPCPLDTTMTIEVC